MNPPRRLPRTPMLAWLRDHLLSPDSGGVRVHGPTGVGKTHLLFELYGHLRHEPGFLVGACRFEGLEEPPLFPIFGALGEAAGSWMGKRQVTPDQLLERVPSGVLPLCRAMLRFSLALGAQAGTREPGSRWRLREVADAHALLEKAYLDDRALFEDTFARLLMVVVRQARLMVGSSRFVFVLDQLERAGRRSRALVELLLSLPPNACAVVVGLNEGGNPPQIPLPRGLNSLPGLEVEPLAEEELVDLYEHWGGMGADRLEPGRLLGETRGNPLSARFLVLAERFRQPFEPNRPYGAAHVRPLLSVLGGPARQLLGFLAMLPLPLYLGRLDWAELLQVDPSTIDPMIQSLVQQGILGMFPRTLVFSHERFREIVIEELNPGERAGLGTRLAKFIECHYGRDLEQACVLPVLSAFHAGLVHAGEAAARLKTASELCEGWYSLGEWEQAREYCEALVGHIDLIAEGEQARVLNILGMVAYHQSRWDRAAEIFAQAQALALARGDTLTYSLVGLNLAGVSLAREDYAAARAAYGAWLDDARSETQLELTWQGWYQLGIAESRGGVVTDALAAYLQAIKAAERSGLMAEAAQVKRELAELLLAHGQLEPAVVWLTQTLEAFRALGDRPGEAELLERLAMAREVQQQPAQAESCWLDAMSRVEDHGQWESVWCTIANNYGSFLHRIGRGDDSARILQRALEVARQAGRTAHEAKILNNLAMLCETLGAPQLALEHARGSLRIKQRLDDRRGVAVGSNNLGTLLFALKHYDEALAAFQESLELWRELGESSGEAIALNNLAMLYECRGEVERALRSYRSSLAIKERLRDSSAVRHTLTNLVVFLDETRRFARAEDCMRTLVALDRASNHPELRREELYLSVLSDKARAQSFVERASS